MILDFCVQKGKYVPLIGSLGIRLCKLKKEYMQSFEKIFRNQYEIIHRLERFELIIVSKFFVDLLGASAISWKVCNFSSTQYIGWPKSHFILKKLNIFIMIRANELTFASMIKACSSFIFIKTYLERPFVKYYY